MKVTKQILKRFAKHCGFSPSQRHNFEGDEESATPLPQTLAGLGMGNEQTRGLGFRAEYLKCLGG